MRVSLLSPMSSVNRALLYLVGFSILVVFLELIDVINFESMYVQTALWRNKTTAFSNKTALAVTVRTHTSSEDTELKSEILPTLESDHWQPVNSTNDVFVYSAYIEHSDTSFVRIIGAIKRTSKTASNLYCLMKYGSEETRRTKSKVYIIQEGHNRDFSANFFICNITKSSDGPPTSVSLVVGPQENKTLNVLPVHDQTMLGPRFNLTACVCPIYSPSHKKNIIEWVETNKILGVEFFTVYVNEVSDKDMKILKHYKSVGIVELRNWTLSARTSPPWNLIHYRGQLTALNDCLYRNKGRSKFTMVIDLDELILPSEPTDLALLKLIQRLPKGNNGLYLFRHSFHGPTKHAKGFNGSQSDATAINNNINSSDHNDAAHKYYVESEMLNNFARSKLIEPPKIRSKVIFRPEAVHTLGIHFAWRMYKPYRQHVVDPSVALVHHYRSRANKEEVEDRTAVAYMDKVIVNMNRTLNHVEKV